MGIDPNDKTDPLVAAVDPSGERPHHTVRAPAAAKPGKPGGLRRWLTRLLATGIALTLVGAGVVLVTAMVLSRELPEIRSLADYRPKQATVVRGKDGQVVARFATERRTVVPYERFPQVVIDAVLAAEDDQFFEHQGVDWVGIARCAVKNALSGRAVCGGSTITQQMVKTFLLTPEKKLTRKLKELMLAKRVEDALSKQDILFLYLNQIYFGHGAYGIEEASRVYFGKSAEKLTLEQAALLAGLPQSPNRLDPFRRPDRALGRRAYVLRRMLEVRKIDQAAHDRAARMPIELASVDADFDNSNHYVAQVRKDLADILTQKGLDPALVQDGGLTVYTGIDSALQRAAEAAVRTGLRELDKRQGWRGPLHRLTPDDLAELKVALDVRRATVSPSIAELPGGGYQPVIWDLTSVAELPPESRTLAGMVEEARFRRLALETTVAGLVTEIDEAAKEAHVALGGEVVIKLPLRTGLGWARKRNLQYLTPRPTTVGEVLKKGDLVLVRPTAFGKPDPLGRPSEVVGVLEQVPEVQAALVAMDPSTRLVRALVGGYGIGAGTFNRATQAERQAGSTFKPFVYGAALEHGFSTISTCLDRPHVDHDTGSAKAWKPKNYDGKFDGEITLRTALTKSKNLCSVWVMDELKRRFREANPGDDWREKWREANPVVKLAAAAGVKARLPADSDALALGSATVTPLEMTNTYATLATGGLLDEPVFIEKVTDPTNAVLYTAESKARQTIKPQLAYLITSLMQSVVEDGTARAVTALKRPVAGKTGTTNDSHDAWFIGFTPDFVAGVWVGFDQAANLGPGETGGRAAIPMWLDFATVALEGVPVHEFAVPPGVTLVPVDPKTGLLARFDAPDTVLEPFLAGTEPTEFGTGAKAPENFGLDDYGQ